MCIDSAFIKVKAVHTQTQNIDERLWKKYLPQKVHKKRINKNTTHTETAVNLLSIKMKKI